MPPAIARPVIVLRMTARRRVSDVARRIASLLAILCALAGFAAVPIDSRILFAAGTSVPPSVQAFAWRVIETRCNYQSHEREERSFWAYDTRARRFDAGVVYSISIISTLTWQRSDPPAFIEMTV